MRTFAQFEEWAKGIGYVVERVGRRIEWYHKNNHSIIGVCSTIQQAKDEIINHYIYLPIT